MKKALIKQKLIGARIFLLFLLGLVIAAALKEDCTFFLFALPKNENARIEVAFGTIREINCALKAMIAWEELNND